MAEPQTLKELLKSLSDKEASPELIASVRRALEESLREDKHNG